MNEEAQRIAIAKACGWIYSHDGDDQGMSYPLGADPKDGKRRELPNYLSDLNAMHEAEKVLTEWQDRGYRNTLIEVTAFQEHRATAAQRAEAFLRSIGKWVEQEQTVYATN